MRMSSFGVLKCIYFYFLYLKDFGHGPNKTSSKSGWKKIEEKCFRLKKKWSFVVVVVVTNCKHREIRLDLSTRKSREDTSIVTKEVTHHVYVSLSALGTFLIRFLIPCLLAECETQQKEMQQTRSESNRRDPKSIQSCHLDIYNQRLKNEKKPLYFFIRIF